MAQYFKHIWIIIIFFLSSCYLNFFNKDTFYKKEKDQLRVVTYNVNHGGKEWQITAPMKTINALKLLDGDVVLLQETNAYWESYFHEYLAALYPYQIFKHDNHGGGLAVLSKYSILNQRYVSSMIGWHPGWIFDVHSTTGIIQIANLHLTPPLINKENPSFDLSAYFSSPQIREKEIRFYYQFINLNRPTIIAGDFNEEDNGFVAQFLNQHGFTDAQSNRGRQASTWRWHLGPFLLHRKLDHIFYNQYLAKGRVQVLQRGDSDHFPLAVDLKQIHV